MPQLQGHPNLPTSASNLPVRGLPVGPADGVGVAGGTRSPASAFTAVRPAAAAAAMASDISSTVVVSFVGRLYAISASVPAGLVAEMQASQWWIVGVGAGFGLLLAGLVYVAIDVGVLRALRRQVVDEAVALAAAEAERHRLESVVDARKDFIRYICHEMRTPTQVSARGPGVGCRLAHCSFGARRAICR
jgi:signal transduction histidine kinase